MKRDDRDKYYNNVRDMAEHPGFENTHKFYEYSAEEVQ
jgi:hypothetical protein